MAKTTVRVALDWTPNTIHSGLYIALSKGYYEEQGLDVQLLPPDDDYTTTPARRLANGEVSLAICPSESCIAYHESGRMKLQAIYAILQRDASAIASTRHSDLRGLEGGVYGSYNARYEDNIVRAMVSAAGGDGQTMKIQNATGKLSLFDQVRRGDLDATWIFLPWEGVEAELDGAAAAAVHAFTPGDYDVPYGYSPVVARDAGSSSSLSDETLRAFVAATARGYEEAMRDARQAVAVLAPHCRPSRSEHFLTLSQRRINEYYGEDDGGRLSLGRMRADKWEAWLAWLRRQGLLAAEDLTAEQLFSNQWFGGMM